MRSLEFGHSLYSRLRVDAARGTHSFFGSICASPAMFKHGSHRFWQSAPGDARSQEFVIDFGGERKVASVEIEWEVWLELQCLVHVAEVVKKDEMGWGRGIREVRMKSAGAGGCVLDRAEQEREGLDTGTMLIE